MARDRAPLDGARARARDADAHARGLATELAGTRGALAAIRLELELLPARVAGLEAAVQAGRTHAAAALHAVGAAAADMAAAHERGAAARSRIERIDRDLPAATAELARLRALPGAEPRTERVSGPRGQMRTVTIPPVPEVVARIRTQAARVRNLEEERVRQAQALAEAEEALRQAEARHASALAAARAAEEEERAASAALADAEARRTAAAATESTLAAQERDAAPVLGEAERAAQAAWAAVDDELAPWHADVDAAVAAAADGDRAAQEALVVLERARDALDAGRGAGDPSELRSLEGAVAAGEAGLAEARSRVAALRAAVDAERTALLAGAAADDLAGLVRSSTPLALLPVRVETRFATEADGAAVLLVRIHPDDLHVDTHEAGLTREEAEWGAHHAQVAAAGGEEQRAALTGLEDRFGAPRAEWIVRATAAAAPGAPAGRAGPWTRAARSDVVPDTWLILGYVGDERVFAETTTHAPVPDVLPIGPDPAGGDDDPGMAWLEDFEAAVALGMAARIRLPEAARAGLTRLLVIGIKPTLGAEPSARRLGAVLEAHRYTNGFERLPQGTPTTSTRDQRAGDPRSRDAADPGAARGAEDGQGDLALLAAALGDPAPAWADERGRDGTEQRDAGDMACVLWPATWGYLLAHGLGDTAPSPATLDDARAHWVDVVRGRGPLPAVRCGSQPYGVLPACSLDAWAPSDATGVEATLPGLLRAAREHWRAAAGAVPRVAEAGNGRAELIAVLSSVAVSEHHGVRAAARLPAGAAPGASASALLEPVAPGATVALDAVGFAPEDLEAAPLVRPETPASIAWLAQAGWEAVAAAASPAGGDTLLFWLLRHGLLRQYADTAARLLAARGQDPGSELAASEAPGPLAALATPVDGLTEGRPLGAWLDDLRLGSATADAAVQDDVAALSDVGEALRRLATCSPAELATLAGEVLDCCSHRLDAWATSMATRRLRSLRRDRPTGIRLGGYSWLEEVRPHAPDGLPGPDALRREADAAAEALRAAQEEHARVRSAVDEIRSAAGLGGIRERAGALESALRRLAVGDARLRDAHARAAAADELRRAAESAHERRAHGGGFVHAPSVAHATTAAILRSGRLEHGAGREAAPLAIDLSSRRAALALTLVDGVRQGQPLAALLGYRLERGLHDHWPGLALDRYLPVLRALAPLGASAAAEQALRDARSRDRQAQEDLDAARAYCKEQLDAVETLRTARAAALEGEAAEIARLEPERSRIDAALRAAESAYEDQLDALARFWPDLAVLAREGRTTSIGFLDVLALLDRLWPEGRAAREAIERLRAERASNEKALQAARERYQRHDADSGGLDERERAAHGVVAEAETAKATAETAVGDAGVALATILDGLVAQANESIPARNVVDGLALVQRYRTGRDEDRWDTTTIPFGAAGLPDVAAAAGAAILAELAAIDDALDALGDVMLAETVHHLAQGNVAAAGAAADAISRGEVPVGELAVLRTPRSGIAVTHRLVVLLDPSASGDTGWPVDDRQVRALADPELERWIARLLGPASAVRCRARMDDGAGGTREVELTLDTLRLSALDAVHAGRVGAVARTELHERVAGAFAAGGQGPGGGPPELIAGRSADWQQDVLGLDELVLVARAAGRLLDVARAADARDLAPAGEARDAGIAPDALARRAQAVVARLRELRTRLRDAGEDERDEALLDAAAFGVAGAVPGPEATPVAAGVLGELERRVAAAEAVADGGVAGDRARLAAALGADPPLLTPFALPAEGGFARALADSDAVQDADPLAAVTFLQRAARVRDRVERFDAALSLAEAVQGPDVLQLRVAQLPYRPGDRWAALPAAPGGTIAAGRTGLVVQSDPVLDVTGPVAGLVVDEWVDVVPSAEQLTGLTFQFGSPGAEAPQAILLAVAPPGQGAWDLRSLEATVLETLDWAKLRAVDPARIPRVGHLLPAILLAADPPAETVTTDPARIRAA